MQNAERLVLPPAAIYDSSSDSDQHIRGDYRLRNDFHCVKRVVIQYCITRVFMCYAHVIHVLSACV